MCFCSSTTYWKVDNSTVLYCAVACRFVPAKFEELFSKFDHGSKGGLTLLELLEMTEANRNVLDFFGW